jgi:hypothetical protein
MFLIRGKQARPRGPELQEMRIRLLQQKTWRYLRYVHTREAFRLTEGAKTVLTVGAGTGLAELALALEYPDVDFHLTDIVTEKTPNYQGAQHLAKKWNVGNISFGVLDILDAPAETADLVTSTEVLEHIAEDEVAAANICARSRQYVFTLVPFATGSDHEDSERRQRAWQSHGHYRIGYDSADLIRLFGQPVAIRGCYWKPSAREFRETLTGMSVEEIARNSNRLMDWAHRDIVDRIPRRSADAFAIWALTRRILGKDGGCP